MATLPEDDIFQLFLKIEHGVPVEIDRFAHLAITRMEDELSRNRPSGREGYFYNVDITNAFENVYYLTPLGKQWMKEYLERKSDEQESL